MEREIRAPSARSRRCWTRARELLAEERDVGSLTVEAVAAHTGVAKTTIYRRWRDERELALDAVMIDMIPGFGELQLTGGLR
jgi:AcrR family transcriptional regulator